MIYACQSIIAISRWKVIYTPFNSSLIHWMILKCSGKSYQQIDERCAQKKEKIKLNKNNGKYKFPRWCLQQKWLKLII